MQGNYQNMSIPITPGRASKTAIHISDETNIGTVIPGNIVTEYCNIKGLSGLANMGNTCYMNSALQALCHNYPLTNYLFNNEDEIKMILRTNAKKIIEDVTLFKVNVNSPIPLDLRVKLHSDNFDPSSLTEEEMGYIYQSSITGQLTKLLKFMWADNCRIAPTSFKFVFSEARNKFFYGYEQHDAEEAYSCIVQKMQEELATKMNVGIKLHRTEGLVKYCEKIRMIEQNQQSQLDKSQLFNTLNKLNKEMSKEAMMINACAEMRKYYNSSYSRITDIFSGFTVSSISCPNEVCAFSSRRFEPFLHLSLPIPAQTPNHNPVNVYHSAYHSHHSTVSNTSHLSIYDCFKEYCKNEILDENNLWKCDGCNNKVAAHKRIQLWECPPFLVIQLKRFGLDRRFKDQRFVKYPMTGLDIRPFISDNNTNPAPCYTYRLQSVIDHIGGLHGGHYYSYCMDEDTQKWFRFDDCRVTVTDTENVVSSRAYILFYMREDLVISNTTSKTSCDTSSSLD